MNRSSQRGSAIIMLFIAVVLFGLLAYAFLQGTRGSTNMITGEQTKAAAYQSQDYNNAINLGVKRLKLRGCTDAQISYETPNGNNINPSAPADKSCHVFQVAGGGVKFQGSDPIPVPKIVFATSTTYDGNLGGVAGADAKCAARATAAGLTGAYKAWLAAGSSSPATTFIRSPLGYVRVDGVKIADDWADLTDGTLDAGISKTESNGSPYFAVWTNVKVDGTAEQVGSYNCNDFAATGDSAYVGNAYQASSSWTIQGSDACTTTKTIYCFQQ
jgi:hypothetical protein